MRINGDYHTHSRYSRNGHGKGEIAGNAESAYRQGLREVAICDHGPGHVFFGVDPTKLKEMRAEVDRLNLTYENEDFRVLLGMEANVTSYRGEWDLEPWMVELLDIRVCGFHYGVKMADFRSAFLFFVLNPLSKIIPPLRNYMRKQNTDALIILVEKHDITFLSHPGEKAEVDILRLAAACAKRGVALEINSHHEKLSIEDIKKVADTGVKFIINSDAHSPEDVGMCQNGIDRAVAAGLRPSCIVNATE